jgi:DNA-binding XRE family transcriptional regulator
MHNYAGGHFTSSPASVVPSSSLPSARYMNQGFGLARSTGSFSQPRPTTPSYVAPVRTDSSPALLPRDISSRFGLRLRELRRSRNMTQLRMAVDFGIDRSFISDVERGRKSISLHMLEVIALGMHVTLSDLLSGI